MFALMAASCSTPSPESKASLAQCQLDVNSSAGVTFRKNYANGSFTPSGQDGSYREYMLLCMQSKGYSFKMPFPNGDLNTACWIEDGKGGLPDAIVDFAECYERSD
jgi:hypothetical protein